MREHVTSCDNHLIQPIILKFDKQKDHHTSSVIAKKSLLQHTSAIVSSSSLVKTLPVGF